MNSSKMQQNKLETLTYFLKLYPHQSAFVLLALFTTSALETIGIMLLLPVINLSFNANNASSKLSGLFEQIFSFLHLPMALESLLGILVALFFFKALLLMFTKKYIWQVDAAVAYEFQNKLVSALVNAQLSHFVKIAS